MNQNPEQIARDKIDQMLIESGWLVKSKDKVNLSAGIGVVEYNDEEKDFILSQLYNCNTHELQPSLQHLKKTRSK